MKRIIFLGFILLALCSCETKVDQQISSQKVQKYQGYFISEETKIPFRMIWEQGDSLNQFTFVNAEQNDTNNVFEVKNDTNWIHFPIYNKSMSLEGKWGDTLNGALFVYDKDANVYQYWEAFPVDDFPLNNTPSNVFKEDWVIAFQGDHEVKGILELTLENDVLTASIRKETGDMRFFQGVANGNSFNISTFDGGFMYYLEGTLDGDTIKGQFYSGNAYTSPFVAYKDTSFKLRKAEYIANFEGEEALSFNVYSPDFDTISSSSFLTKGKIQIIQISGSWCANCIDETVYLNELRSKYTQDELGIQGVFFERFKDSSKAHRGLDEMTKTLNLNYPLYLGAKLGINPEDVFIGLKNFSSYPTALVLNKEGKVVYVHTGFSGPGTGKHYLEFKKEFETMLDELIKN